MAYILLREYFDEKKLFKKLENIPSYHMHVKKYHDSRETRLTFTI